MDRARKEQEVSSLKSTFDSAVVTLLAEYKGLTVTQLSDLRRSLREGSSTLKVVKNTLSKKAIEGTPLDVLDPYFVGPIALITSSEDPVSPAKALVKYAETSECLSIKAGFLDGKLLDEKAVINLSKLPGREELLSKLVGSMSAPAQNLVNVLAAVPRQLATVLSAIADQKS